MIKEFDPVVLTTPLPEHGLQAGDVGWVVMVHDAGAGYEVEFVTLAGKTASVVTGPGRKRPSGAAQRDRTYPPSTVDVRVGSHYKMPHEMLVGLVGGFLRHVMAAGEGATPGVGRVVAFPNGEHIAVHALGVAPRAPDHQ
jgi:Domain of unknown function (DUF4926)